MKSRLKRTLLIAALAALNVGLVVAVYSRSTDTPVMAQNATRVMDVMAISGHSGTGNAPGTIYMFDAVSGELVAMRPTLGGRTVFITGRADVFRAMDNMR